MNKVQGELIGAVRVSLSSVALPIGIAFSGGLDSSVLLDVVGRSFAAEDLRAIHVCHNLRSQRELEAELALVRDACRQRHIPLSVVTIRDGAIETYAKEKKCGIEAAARRFRYRALTNVAKKFNLSAIIMAHHADDQIETFLMRLVRGGNLESLSGMPPERVVSVNSEIRIVRPFIKISRSVLAQYAEKANIHWSEDSTNIEPVYLRNRVRNTLMPILDEHFSSWRSAFVHYQTQIMDMKEVVRECASARLSEIEKRANGRLVIDAERLRAEPSTMRVEILKLYIEHLHLSFPMGYRALRQLDDEIMKRARRIESAGYVFMLEHEMLGFAGPARFSSSPEQRSLSVLKTAPKEDYFYIKISSPGEYTCRPFRVRVVGEPSLLIPASRITFGNTAESDGKDYSERYSGAYKIPLRFPFVIRSSRGGDVFEDIHGAKSVESTIKRAGLSPGIRDAVPVVEDATGIVAVLPSACGNKMHIRDTIREASLGEGAQIVYIFLSMKGDQFINA